MRLKYVLLPHLLLDKLCFPYHRNVYEISIAGSGVLYVFPIHQSSLRISQLQVNIVYMLLQNWPKTTSIGHVTTFTVLLAVTRNMKRVGRDQKVLQRS